MTSIETEEPEDWYPSAADQEWYAMLAAVQPAKSNPVPHHILKKMWGRKHGYNPPHHTAMLFSQWAHQAFLNDVLTFSEHVQIVDWAWATPEFLEPY